MYNLMLLLLQIDEMETQNYHERNNIAKWATRIFILLFLGGIRFVLVKSESYHYWAWIRIIALLIYLICQFGMFIGPSMFYAFKDPISINSDSIEDGNLLSSQSAQDSVNQLIGYALYSWDVMCYINVLFL